ncbi:phage tail tape measure protein [Weissella confusa]|uniref:phage tail tape measure protein n=1 Tax=Weissella confusa TaxID=1583 RepID=UPI0013E09F4E|nr:phage tail tape measure protein [Weissella confusa]QIE78203.1 transglycosylase SLT domain-containing protein [Weissella confusa]
MAKEKVAGLMSTEIGLNTAKATQGLNELKSAVKDSTNEWKQMESQMKASGDEIGASEAKYKGLSQSVEKQQDVLQKLRQEQAEVNRSTQAGEATYQKYASQITTAERQLNSMIAQQAKAKQAYELQESGIAGLNKEIQQSIKETDAYVERLKAEGREEEALKAQKEGLSRTLDKQSQLYEAQSRQLEKMTKSGDASSESISKQKIALDKTATSIAKGKQSLEELDLGQAKIGKNEGATEAGGKFEKLTGAVGKTTAGLTATVAVAGTALAGVSKLVGAIYDQQGQVSAMQAKTTGSYKESKEAISAINKLYAQGYGESVEDLTETYTKLKQMNPKAQVGELAEQTKLVTQYSKASGADTEEVLKGAQNATKAWHMSYQDYFDNLFTLQKQGGDVGGEISDNMAEYSQVLGQMGLSAKDSFSMIANGIKTGAYNGDKLLDFTKEFSISLNDGHMDKSISEFSKKSQDMFQGYKDGKVTAGDMFKQITGEMGKMTDKQKEATLASNLWSALGEDNSLKVLESLGKQNKAFDNVKGTAKKTSDQLKESNPFDLMKRSAEASLSSVTMSATETKNFKKALAPLQKAMKNFIDTAVKNLPKIAKAITPVVNFVANNGKLIMTILTTMLALNFTGKAINGISKLHGSVKDLMPTVTNVAKKGKNAFKWTASLGKKAFMATLGAIKTGAVATGRTIGKAIKWTASLGKTVFTKSIGAIKTVALGTGKLIGKSLKFTASIATKGANLAMAGLVKTAKATGTGIKLAFNFLKANPLILLVTAITAVVVALVELYKHNKKFRQFVDGLVKSAKQFFEGITKWFGNAWASVTKAYNSFSKSFSKGWHSFTDGIGKAWNATWSYVSNIFDKYINIYKRVIKTFTDFFTGNWGNLGKDIRGIWNALWDYVESIFGKKVGSIKHGIEGFGSKIWSTFQTIKDKVSGFWSDMWNGLKDFARDGINNVIGVINNGIGGINTVIHTFGGKKNAIGKIPKFANGTKGAPKGLAIVNDAPGEHYQEAIIDNSGRATVLEGRNRLVNFSGGETVIPAHALPKFAHGTDNWLDTAIGWISDKWDKLTEFIAHPIKALGNVMNRAVSGIAGSPLVTNIAPAMANGLVQGIADPIVNMFKSLKKKHDDEGASAPAGSGVHRWKDLVIKALDKNGLSTSESMVNKVLRQIQSESGGNEKAVQGGYTDINTITGDLAKGLMQTISATFNAYAFPGHKNIFNGYDNLLAALAYAKNRYGSNLAGLGEGHGYAQGGIVSQHGFYEVAEQNMPEIIIPLDPAKKMRANELLAEANQRINGAQSQQIVVQSDTAQLEQKFDNVIALLSLMLGVNQDQLKALQSQSGINLPNLMNQMGMAQTTHNYQSI